MSKTIGTERDGRTLTVRVENPPHNFMNRGMIGELDELTRSLEGDRSVGAVVITGGIEGRFITHYDVEEILTGSEGVGMEVSSAVAAASLRTVGGISHLPRARAALKRTPASGLVELHAIHDVLLRIGRLDKVFIAAINGTALGGGLRIGPRVRPALHRGRRWSDRPPGDDARLQPRRRRNAAPRTSARPRPRARDDPRGRGAERE